MHQVDALPELKTLKVRPYMVPRRCNGCGIKARQWPYWLLRLLGPANTIFKLIHCQGGLDPQVTIQTPFGERQGIHVCAGVAEEHVHVICSLCGYQFLMKSYR